MERVKDNSLLRKARCEIYCDGLYWNVCVRLCMSTAYAAPEEKNTANEERTPHQMKLNEIESRKFENDKHPTTNIANALQLITICKITIITLRGQTIHTLCSPNKEKLPISKHNARAYFDYVAV